jgi:hypothetical protein
MSVKTDNLNLNLNLNLAAAAAGGGAGRPRYNTEDFAKLVDAANLTSLALPTATYSPDWDPELRAWAYVEEFMSFAPGIITDIATSFKTQPGVPPLPTVTFPPFPPFPPYDAAPYDTDPYDLTGFTPFPVPPAQIPALSPSTAVALNPTELANQVVGLLNVSIDRGDRALEIVDQANGPGALNYWLGMLRIDPSQDKHTYLLMLVARKIGEFVAMGLKDIYRMRRPSQVFPNIMPLIDPPDTPSFPSSHSLQARLISMLLSAALPPPAASTTGSNPAIYTRKALSDLADRVALNREIAGVHYRMDSDAGKYAAGFCASRILNAAIPGGPARKFRGLFASVRNELKDLPP